MSEKNNEKKVTIPIEGSLGILALGDVGLKMWREVRDNFIKENKQQIDKANAKGAGNDKEK